MKLEPFAFKTHDLSPTDCPFLNLEVGLLYFVCNNPVMLIVSEHVQNFPPKGKKSFRYKYLRVSTYKYQMDTILYFFFTSPFNTLGIEGYNCVQMTKTHNR